MGEKIAKFTFTSFHQETCTKQTQILTKSTVKIRDDVVTMVTLFFWPLQCSVCLLSLSIEGTLTLIPFWHYPKSEFYLGAKKKKFLHHLLLYSIFLGSSSIQKKF